MKLLLYGRYGSHPQDIEDLVQSFGFELVTPSFPNQPNHPNLPEAIITYGGDGTLIGSERDYPGIPKLPLRDSDGLFKGHPQTNDQLLGLLKAGKLRVKDYPKLEVDFQGQNFLVVNDIAIRNSLINTALRFSVSINGTSAYSLDPSASALVGDGLVIATSFGSTGYYFSITKQKFVDGFGIAFNNIHNAQLGPIVLGKDKTVEVTIVRGPGQLAMDNNPQIFDLKDGDVIKVIPSKETTKILTPQ